MKTISVKAVKRADFGKKAAKVIRREGMVPCVLCGNGETETFSVDPREIKPLIYTPNSYIVEFDIEGKKEQAVLREAQFHPVREEILPHRRGQTRIDRHSGTPDRQRRGREGRR